MLFFFSPNLFSGCCDGSSRRFLTDFLQEFPTPGTGPYFDSTIPSNITGLVGKNVHLVCKVKNLGNRTVSLWMLNTTKFPTDCVDIIRIRCKYSHNIIAKFQFQTVIMKINKVFFPFKIKATENHSGWCIVSIFESDAINSDWKKKKLLFCKRWKYYVVQMSISVCESLRVCVHASKCAKGMLLFTFKQSDCHFYCPYVCDWCALFEDVNFTLCHIFAIAIGHANHRTKVYLIFLVTFGASAYLQIFTKR